VGDKKKEKMGRNYEVRIMNYRREIWIPACAGMTDGRGNGY